MAPSAVVIGLGSVTGLQTARILAGRGVRVIGIAGDRRHFAARTRVCERIIEADVHGAGFIDVLERLAPDLDEGAVLFPCTDQSVLLVSEHRERLTPAYSVVMPPHEVVRGLADKATFRDYAVGSGLVVPQTFVLHGVQDARRAAAELTFPAVIKPSVKCPRWKKNTRVKVRMVDNADELLSAYDDFSPWTAVLIAQEFVRGTDAELFTCNSCCDESGEPLVTFVTRKVRQWPPYVGTASLGEEVRNDEVVAHTRAALPGREVPRPRVSGVQAAPGQRRSRGHRGERRTPDGAVGHRRGGWRGAAVHDVLRCGLLSAVYYYRRGELSPREWFTSVRGPSARGVLVVGPAPVRPRDRAVAGKVRPPQRRRRERS